MKEAPVTTTFFLVRHATHSRLDHVLAGRMPGIHLDDRGIAQAQRLARRLSREGVTAVHSSPRERAIETAREIALSVAGEITVEPAIDEIDCGEWTGCTFDQLRTDPRWTLWNSARSTASIPSGESMAEVQQRALHYLGRQADREPEGRIVSVSHGDVIKAALLGCIGASLDRIGRIEISPAGVSTVVVGDWGYKVLSVNEAFCS